MPVVWPADTLGYKMKDYVTLGQSYGVIDSTRLSGNVLRLYLSPASNATTVSYIPLSSYRGTSSVYMGPFIRNTRGVGALTFLDFPITAASSVEADMADAGRQPRLSVSPNPFTPSTRILAPGYRPGSGMTLKVYTATGRMVADLSSGARVSGSVEWNATGLPSGIYLVQCTAAGRTRETRAVYAK